MSRGDKNKGIDINSILDNMYKRYHLDSKVIEMKIKEEWGNLFGEIIQKHTSEITMKDKTIYIKVDNPPLKNELFLQRHLIIGKINEHFGEVVVEKIFIAS